MPTVKLASQYNALVVKAGTGNPPGESLSFNGSCFASDQRGFTVWTGQVQPTGHVRVDWDILRAVAPRTLAPSYLRQHCIS
jgi:hypothetical protein